MLLSVSIGAGTLFWEFHECITRESGDMKSKTCKYVVPAARKFIYLPGPNGIIDVQGHFIPRVDAMLAQDGSFRCFTSSNGKLQVPLVTGSCRFLHRHIFTISYRWPLLIPTSSCIECGESCCRILLIRLRIHPKKCLGRTLKVCKGTFLRNSY